MVVSRSDSKRRKKDEVASPQESPKRTKVHAQRKFAQGSHLNNPVVTPVKDKDKAKYNGTLAPTELLPVKRPKTEEFVNFLCFRGSDLLPKSLEIFNEPSIPQPQEEERLRDSSVAGSSKSASRNDKHSDQFAGVVKAEARSKSKPKSTAAVQALKKKYQEQRMAKEKSSLTKIALKVKGKNMMRTRSAGPLDEAPASVLKKPVKNTKLVTSTKSKVVVTRKPVLRKHTTPVKRLNPRPTTRGGLRSGGELPPGSDVGLKTERKLRKIVKLKPAPSKKKLKKNVIASSLSDFSSDDDQPLVKKQRVMPRAMLLARRITTRSRLALNLRATTSQRSSRPTRKTKEAATLFMEMLGKDLRSPDEEEDNLDAISFGSIIELTKRTERKEKEFKDTSNSIKNETRKQVRTVKREENLPAVSQSLLKKKEETNKKSVPKNFATLKTRSLRSTQTLLPNETRLKTLKSTLKTKESIKVQSPKDHQTRSRCEPERENVSSRREKRSVADKNKKSDVQVKEKKIKTSENKDLELGNESAFDESDEEPLGKKVSQAIDRVTNKMPLRSKKPSVSKVDTSLTDDVTELKRIKLLAKPKENTKDSKIVSPTLNTISRKRQSAKITPSKTNDIEVESKKLEKPSDGGNLKSEPITRSRASESSSGKPVAANTKPKPQSQNKYDSKLNTDISSQLNKSKEKKKLKKSSSIENIVEDTLSFQDGKQSSRMKTILTSTNKEINKNEVSPLKEEKELQLDVSCVPSSSETKLQQDLVQDIAATKSHGSITKICVEVKDPLTICDNDEIKLNDQERDEQTHSRTSIDFVSNSNNNDNLTKLDHICPSINPQNETTKEEKGEMSLSKKESSQSSQLENSTNDKNSEHKTDESKVKSIKDMKQVDSLPLTKIICSKSDDGKNITTSGNLKEVVNTYDNNYLAKVEEGNASSLFNNNKNNCDPKQITDVNSIEKINFNKKDNILRIDEGKSNTESNAVDTFQIKGTVPKISKKSSLPVESTDQQDRVKEKIPKPSESRDMTNLYSKEVVKKFNVQSLSPGSQNDQVSEKEEVKKEKVKDNLKKLILDETNVDNKKPILNAQIQMTPTQVSNSPKSQSSLQEMSLSSCKPPSQTQLLLQKCDKTGKNKGVVDLMKTKSLEYDGKRSSEVKTIQNVTNTINVAISSLLEKKSEPKYVSKVPLLDKTLSQVKHYFDQQSCDTLLKVEAVNSFKSSIYELQSNFNLAKLDRETKACEAKTATQEDSLNFEPDSLEMSDKISSAVDSLMSLKNVQKLDEMCDISHAVGSSSKTAKAFDLEHKKVTSQDYEFKLMQEVHSKRIENQEIKRVKFQEPDVKRVTLETDKRVTLVEGDLKRSQTQEFKPKPEPSQVLKGCAHPKSMLKPGTLIDIAGISHSPDIMTPLRPGSDGEIIPMNKPVRLEPPEPYKMGLKVYEPRVDQNFGYKWQTQNAEKSSLKSDSCSEKDVLDSKSGLSLNKTAWKTAFMNVKEPKSNSNAPVEKPAARKQLSVTALAKRHSKCKSEAGVTDKPSTSSQPPIPFLRQNKPFLGTISPSKGQAAVSSTETSNGQDVKRNSVDLNSLREKEAEVEEFLRQVATGGMNRTFTPVATLQRGEDMTINLTSDKMPTSNSGTLFSTSSTMIIANIPEKESENLASKQLSQLKHNSKPIQHINQQSSFISFESSKRSNSPSSKRNQHLLDTSNSVTGPNTITISGPQLGHSSYQRSNSPNQNFQNKLTLNDIISDGNSSKSNHLTTQTLITVTTSSREVSQPSLSTPSAIVHQSSSNESPLKNLQCARSLHSSPTQTNTYQSMNENIFKDCGTVKRTKSPTLAASYSPNVSRSNSPQGSAVKRNSSSPVPIKCSKNIFKEVVPATRSYSPIQSICQSENEPLSNLFSQNPGYKRSISPLCNKPAFQTVSGTTVVSNDKSGLQGETRCQNVSKSAFIPNKSSVLDSLKDEETSDQQTNMGNMTIKQEPLDNEVTISLSTSFSGDELNKKIKADMQSTSKGNAEGQTSFSQSTSNVEDSKLLEPGTSAEAKHRLPLPVEQTLKQRSQGRLPNKKSSQLHSVKSNEPVKPGGKGAGSAMGASLETIQSKITKSPVSSSVPRLSTGIYCHNQEEELDLKQKKKVNMTAEEIKRWLNDSSSSLIEHRPNCGVLENNVCECEYKDETPLSLQNVESLSSVNPGKDSFPKPENDITCQTESLDSRKIETEGLNNPRSTEKVKRQQNVKEKKAIIEKKPKTELVLHDVANTIPDVSDNEDKKEIGFTNKKKIEEEIECSNTAPLMNPLPVSTPVKNSQNEELPLELPTTPVNKLRSFKLGHKDSEQETSLLDTSEISSPPLRDDISSSNDVSSSNDETPDKFAHPERRAIFHKRRAAMKVSKEHKELLPPPSVNAFSPENESSVYAFEPDLPPASMPFRRTKGKDSRPNNAATDEDEATPCSNSIAVQVNFDNEAVLECSTQTDVQEGDDDDTHTFYIPLQQSNPDTTKLTQPLIQGVALKLDTEGPDQKVIMRAKLVTKPLSTFSRSSSSPARALMGPRAGKPEQKVRPLSVKPPVGTVQPTARPKPRDEVSVAGSSKSSNPSPTPSPQALRLAKRTKSKAPVPSTSVSESQPLKTPPAKLVEAPTFYPTEKEFEDPLEYINNITPQAEKYGLCRVVPPANFKPECKVSDDMRFTAYNQYIHKMLHRWGPNVKEMLAIKKYLATQSIALTHPPWVGGMEVDLPRLYQTVQQCGGLKEVIEKKRWQRVADAMKIPKSAQDRVTKLDDIYCKFLLPYDTLSHAERTQLFDQVEKDWIEREKRVANAQDDDEDDESDSDSDIDECIVKGRSMALSAFYRIARNTMSMWFSKTDTPPAADVELEFWKHVASRQHHVCVHSGSIDTGSVGYGFPTGKNSSTSRHPWNLKMLTNNPGSILRFLGPLMGVTVPTLHVGMLFSACCWYRDPHGLPWIEYLHTGASKIWYGIPDSSSGAFRSAVTSLVPRLVRDKTLWLASDTAMVPPPLLVEHGVSLSRVVQDPGQFIIVFPKAYTSSVCTGYVVSESVYFAQPSWLVTAQNLFNDLRESSEPTVFSLDKLLFSIVNDSRSSVEALSQILPIVVSLRDGEVAGRRQLEELGLHASERLHAAKRRKVRQDDDDDQECDQCRTSLFISFMSNSHDGAVYCLPHAVELLSHKRSQVKHCTLIYAFSEDELEELVEKLKSRIENRNQKKVQNKNSKS